MSLSSFLPLSSRTTEERCAVIFSESSRSSRSSVFKVGFTRIRLRDLGRSIHHGGLVCQRLFVFVFLHPLCCVIKCLGDRCNKRGVVHGAAITVSAPTLIALEGDVKNNFGPSQMRPHLFITSVVIERTAELTYVVMLRRCLLTVICKQNTTELLNIRSAAVELIEVIGYLITLINCYLTGEIWIITTAYRAQWRKKKN